MSTFVEKNVEDFATRLKEVIGNESVNSFAKRAGISYTGFTLYLKGSMPGIDKASAIADAAGVNIEWLVNGTGEKFRGFKAKPQAEFETLPSNINKLTEITPDLVAQVTASLYGYLEDKNMKIEAKSFGDAAAAGCQWAAEANGFNPTIIERLMRLSLSK